jgi:hypothetical protein
VDEAVAMSESEDHLASIRQRRAAITKPPWRALESLEGPDYIYDWSVTTGPQDPRYPDYRPTLADELLKADAEFIAHAPEDVDALLRDLARCRDLLGQRIHQVGQLKDRLRELEWAGTNQAGEPYCPACIAVEGLESHDPDCWLAAEIKPV